MQNLSSAAIGGEQLYRNRKLRFIKSSAKQIQNIETQKLLGKLKQNHGQSKDQQTSKIAVKPVSAIGRRPGSSRKRIQTLHSTLTTTCSAKSEQQVKQAISTVFTHSKKLHTYLQQQNIDQQKVQQSLLGNQLFTLSLVSMVSNKNNQEANKHIERSCIHKIDRMLAMQKQKQKCESIQNKIGQLIEKRLKALSLQFS